MRAKRSVAGSRTRRCIARRSCFAWATLLSHAAAWDKSVAQAKQDLRAMQRLVRDPATDLFARIPHGTGQTVLREALVLADHNSYHLGQLVLLRRLLGAWKGD